MLSSESGAYVNFRFHGIVALGYDVSVNLRIWLVVCWFLYPI